MSEPARPSTFALLETRARHLILLVGLGFLGLVGGGLISSALMLRLAGRFDAPDAGVAEWVLLVLVRNLYALAVLPALAWLCLTFLPIRPGLFAWATQLSALAFQLALELVTVGFDGPWAEPVLLVVRLAAFFAGVALSYSAGRQGALQAAARDAAARAKAQQAKAQYDEFARKALELADRREAQPVVASAPSPEPPPAPTAPDPAAEAADPPKPQG